jgi:hypothetical protein
MADTGHVALIHAEIDGELDGQQRAELARRLLADPEARALREDLKRLCTELDTTEDVEPPAQLQASVLRALPHLVTPPRQFAWPAPHWRYAALILVALGAATAVYETVDGPGPGTAEMAGTIAATRTPAALDTVRLDSGSVTGRVSLYRAGAGLGLVLELVASAPVDVLIATDGHTLRVNGLGQKVAPPGLGGAIALPGSGTAGRQTVQLTFLMSGREVGRATLTAAEGH